MPEEDESVTIDLRKHKTLADIPVEIPRDLTKVQEAIWILKNKKKVVTDAYKAKVITKTDYNVFITIETREH